MLTKPMEKNKGWVKLWRDQFQHWVSERKPWCDGYAWSYLYARANYKDGTVNFRNQYIPIKRGQFVTSILKLSKTFGWTWRRTRSFLENLQSEEMLIFKFNIKLNRKTTKLKEEYEVPSFNVKSHIEQHNRQHNRFLIITILNYERFQSSPDEDSTTDMTTDMTTGAQQAHTNKNLYKKKKIYVEDSDELRLASFLLEEIQRNKPDFKQPNLQAWAKDIDLMIRKDGRVTDRIKEVIRWAQGDSFWRSNILSTGSLRKQFDRLELAMQKTSIRGPDQTIQYQDLTGRGSA